MNISFKGLCKTFVMVAAIFVATAAKAEVKECLVVHDNDGKKTFYVLEDTPTVTFVGENLHVKSESAEADHLLSSVAKFTFESGEASVKDLLDDECRITVRNNEVLLEGFKAGSPVNVYSLAGVRVLAEAVGTDGTATVSLSQLNVGVYVVSTVSKSIKVVVK